MLIDLGELNGGSTASLFSLSWPGARDSTADLSLDFDFSQFAQFSLDDLGNYLTGLQHWLAQLI